jgi:hypothetical protein
VPSYEYRCNTCGDEIILHLSFTEHDELRDQGNVNCSRLPFCDGTYQQVISFGIIASMPEHWNPSTGNYTTSAAQFRSDLSRASDEATARTGMPHNFQPIDPYDATATGVTGDGLDATYDHQVKTGQRDPKKYL